LKNNESGRDWGMAQGPEFNVLYCQIKKKNLEVDGGDGCTVVRTPNTTELSAQKWPVIPKNSEMACNPKKLRNGL
jgi:hypothetical protein